jgi:hypothetical protein
MKKIDEGYDKLLKSDYELYAINFCDLKELAKSWHNVNLDDFNDKHTITQDRWIDDHTTVRFAGIISNNFFAYREDGVYYLMDGFKRLFSNYGQDYDTTVYLKVLTSKLSVGRIMNALLCLNFWKLAKSGNDTNEFHVNNFLDRGLRLFLHNKYNLDFYNYTDYSTRTRCKHDFEILDFYFHNEHEMVGYFKYDARDLLILFNNDNIINDFREIVESNNYLKPEFGNYHMFLEGFVMFLSSKRVAGDNSEYKFKTYLNKLYENKVFFKKLVNMSGNDSTRKNIYNFYKNL